jgi:fructokinase
LFGVKGTDEEVCKYFMDKYNLKYVILTAGEKYSVVYSKTEKSYIETPKVSVADTVGAGDAFSGAFVQGILMGKSLQEAHKQAVEISAFVCTKTGAWPEYDQVACSK